MAPYSFPRPSGATNHLGVLDRFFASWQDVGVARRFSIGVAYPNAAVAPSAEQLSSRMDQLIKLYPILSAKVSIDSAPRWIPVEPAVRGTDIVKSLHYTSWAGESALNACDRLCVEGQDRLCDSGDVYAGRTFAIDLVSPDKGSNEASTVLVFIVDHIITDGSGFLRLVHLILSPNLPSDLSPEPLDNRPVAELAYPVIKPDAEDIAVKNTEESGDPIPWGFRSKAGSPFDIPERYCYSSLSSEQVQGLKEIGKSRGIRTITPLLYATYVLIVWEVAGKPTSDMVIEQARSERAAMGKSALYWSGNFFCNPALAVNPSKSSDVWSLARDLQDAVREESLIQDARYRLGSWAHVKRPMAEAFREMAQSSQPFRVSVCFTNLTRTSLPPNACDLSWISGATPSIAPILVHMVGHEAGVRVGVAIRDGAALTLKEAEEVNTKWLQSLEQLLGATS